MINKIYTDMAPCLLAGPISEVGRELLQELKSLGTSPMATVLRTWAVIYLYNDMESVLAGDEDPVPKMVSSCSKIVNLSRNMKVLIESLDHISFLDNENKQQDNIDYDHFGNLFSNNVVQSFWEQPYKQLSQRLLLNDVSLDIFKDATIIDIGCGSGRNAFVLKELGAKKVIGVDISKTGIALAKARQKELSISEGLEFFEASAMDLPFDDNSFDLAFSMGVFHHTPSWQQCFSEMYRVIKPQGTGLLMYLNEKPGGLFYDVIELLRCIVHSDNQIVIQKSFEILGINPTTIIKHLDPLLCDVNTRLTIRDIESQLDLMGASNVRRFTRGTGADRVEKVYHGKPFAKEKFGIGEQRYIFTKNKLLPNR
ncbi:hypothetical protein MNBD_GAMMA18-797 [hydrothermal vent metagenome]|uniref:Methyltransferase type 11 domain-containing protein n=1 Tax=hydrothermal vent metagenome TaxID=652676 RepID=A0A3B0YUA3_9ZZZZ